MGTTSRAVREMVKILLDIDEVLKAAALGQIT